MLLVGMSFFGDPFSEASDWSSDNEIGKLWSRFINFIEANPNAIRHRIDNEYLYEIHIDGPNTERDGQYEIFVGTQVTVIDEVPLQCVVKKLPTTAYAVFSLEGENIFSDWGMDIYRGWMPTSEYETSHRYNIQAYGKRFKGMDRIEESELDVYVPIRLKDTDNDG